MTLASWWSPTTDTGVVVQVIVTVVVAVVIAVVVRRERALVLLTTGVTLVVLGWYGIRGLH
jgi:hypothetical protein